MFNYPSIRNVLIIQFHLICFMKLYNFLFPTITFFSFPYFLFIIFIVIGIFLYFIHLDFI